MKPATVFGIYRVTCILMAILFLAGGLFALVSGRSLEPTFAFDPPLDPSFVGSGSGSDDQRDAYYAAHSIGIRLPPLTVFLACISLATLSALLPTAPRNPQWWRVHLLHCAIHCLTGVLFVPAVFTLIHLFRADMKAWFGFPPPPSAAKSPPDA